MEKIAKSSLKMKRGTLLNYSHDLESEPFQIIFQCNSTLVFANSLLLAIIIAIQVCEEGSKFLSIVLAIFLISSFQYTPQRLFIEKIMAFPGFAQSTAIHLLHFAVAFQITVVSAQIEVPNHLNPISLSNIFRNKTLISNIKSFKTEDCNKVPEDWIPPYNMSTKFKVYQSGYDDMNRPIFIAEIGTWDIRSEVEAGEDHGEAFEKYLLQLCHSLLKQIPKAEDGTDGDAWAIFDAEGLNIRQFTYPPSVALFLRLALSFRELLIRYAVGIVVVNVNFPARLFYNIARPFAGGAVERIELLGANRERWIPQLLHRFPRDQLPPWYGGNKKFKPVKAFG